MGTPVTTGCQDRYVTVNGLRLRYRVSGDRDRTPVLVLHGLMGHLREWDTLTSDLARWHRVYAVDQRGHGGSDWAPDYTLTAMAGDVAALLETLRLGRAALIGHSMGGLIALAVAARRPDLVDRLAILDVGPDSLASDWAREALPAVLRGFAAVAYPDVRHAMAEWIAGDSLVREPLLRHYLEHVLVRHPDGRLRYRFDAARLHQFGQSVEEAAVWQDIARVAAPTLLVRGEHSEVLPLATATAMIRRLRTGSLVQIPGASHDLGVQQPEAVAAAVRTFLAVR